MGKGDFCANYWESEKFIGLVLNHGPFVGSTRGGIL